MLKPVFLVILLLPFAAGTAGQAKASGDTYSVQWENDRIAKTDRHYTNGFRLSWVSEEKASDPEWVRDLLNRIYPFAALKSGRAGAAFGQSIYTPEDTSATALVQNDRPYAGWLYGGISVHAETSKNADPSSLDMLDTVELDFGIVGPYALGKQVQNGVHELINVANSDGWDNQLDNEPGLMLIGERRWRTAPLDVMGLKLDVIPHLGGSIGNVMTFA
ncbi:MAG: lipid A deacylase LpxR family protein, partial [Alphaproteobacteria bacterium]